MEAESKPRRLCPECGAENPAQLGRCWLCGAPVGASISVMVEETTVERPAPSAPSFHLDSLMLTITLIAVGFGIARLSLWLGVLLAVVAIPAYLRTAMAARRSRGKGKPMDIPQKLGEFATSAALVTAIAISCSVAFYATCWGGFFAGAGVAEAAGKRGYDPLGYGLVTGIIVGSACGLLVAFLLFRRYWPLERKPRPARRT